MPAKNFLTQEAARALFRYDPKSGNLYWRFGPPNRIAAHQSGVRRSDGTYSLAVNIGKIHYAAHNIIWVYVTGKKPKGEVDHINRIKCDNRWSNLREASRSQNQANTGLYKNNTTGYRGVSFDKSIGRYRAIFSKNGKNRCLGVFDRPEEAHEAWKQTAIVNHGEFLSL